MDKLDSNWLVNGLVDFEYKKYTLLAYLQSVDKRFNSYQLFPCLSDLISHYEQLQLFKDRKQALSDQFPREIIKADLEKMNFEYNSLFEDDELMKIIEDVVLYAKPLFRQGIEQGKVLYDEVETHMGFYPVGVTPINRNEGYLMVVNMSSSILKIYRYTMSLFESSGAEYRALHMFFVEERKWTPWNTLENVKLTLLKSYPDLPNPAAYAIEVKKKLPEEETILPV
ncbi:MAG: hypothetical protein JWO58_1012, partial [Chitinophagaceae bacterium]|nr:hypothetical protein [Chitinophagaceae bacterium]